MGIVSQIINGFGEKKTGARVSLDGAVHVISSPHPPTEPDILHPLPYAQFFTNNGSNDMKVAGTLQDPIAFRLTALEDYDIFINTITIQISDANLSLNGFGGLPALTNGINFTYLSGGFGEIGLLEPIKTNLQFFREATGGKGFGQTTKAWVADVSGVGAETYFPEINLFQRYGAQYGVKLRKGSSDQLIFSVRDDLTGVDTFNIKGHGIIARDAS